MSDNVIYLHPKVTYGNIKVDEMFSNILECINPEHAFVICWPKDGEPPTYHSTTGDLPVVVFRCQQFIHDVFNGGMREEIGDE